MIPAALAPARSRVVLLLLVAVLSVLGALPAAAHTQLDSTEPADGGTAPSPVEEVTLRFSLPVTQLGDGVEITDGDGAVVDGVSLESSEDGAVWVARLAEPLEEGAYAVSWTMAAQDGHPLDGDFGFAVALPGEDAGEATAGDSAAGTSAPPAEPGGSGEDDAAPPAPVETDATEAGLVTAATGMARLGHAIALWGALVSAGALAFAGIALRGRDAQDRPVVVGLARVAAVLVLVGVAVRVAGRTVQLADGDVLAVFSPDAVSTAVGETTRWVFGLQALGAVLVLLGARRGASLRGLWPAWAGVALVGAGHVLGGHSATATPRWLVLASDVTHLVAGALWVGGVISLAWLLRHRRRAGEELGVGAALARFSTAAAASLLAVGVTGVALAWTILESLDQLWTSTWGVLLLVKVLVVALVAALGAVNHLVIVPALASRHHAGLDPEDAARRGRTTTMLEAALMTAAVVLTAFLVGASTLG